MIFSLMYPDPEGTCGLSAPRNRKGRSEAPSMLDVFECLWTRIGVLGYITENLPECDIETKERLILCGYNQHILKEDPCELL